jgi:subtilisin-like proprotein convertase family protein
LTFSLPVSLRYGYGLMDASAMVNLALMWNTVPAKRECMVETSVNHENLDSHVKFTAQVESNGCLGESTEVNYLEHVQAVISLTYLRRGDVIIYLTSPMGTKSKLLPHRPSDVAAGGFDEWPFLSVHFWGENPRGMWLLEIEDADTLKSESAKGTLDSWSLVFYGTKEQPVKLKNQTTTGPLSMKPSTVQPVLEKTTKMLCHNECAEFCTGPSPKDCLECKHYRVGPTSMCVPECPTGFYKEDKMCLACEMSCSTCSGPMLTQCLSCPTGHMFQQLNSNQNVCSVECLSGFFMTNNSCLRCHSSCKDCSQAGSMCTACASDHVLQQNTCIVDSAQGEKEKFTLAALIIGLGILLVLTIIAGLIYLCKHYQICCPEHKKYGKLPIDEDDDIRPYKDVPDETYGIQ